MTLIPTKRARWARERDVAAAGGHRSGVSFKNRRAIQEMIVARCVDSDHEHRRWDCRPDEYPLGFHRAVDSAAFLNYVAILNARQRRHL